MNHYFLNRQELLQKVKKTDIIIVEEKKSC